VSERDFAVLDILVRTKPNANISNLESLIMWVNNGTTRWLSSKEKSEKKEILKKARISVPAVVAKFKNKNKR
jgi:hypothetical protein